jgi:predicted TIM-barrel fold metal-dependent hydrolase
MTFATRDPARLANACDCHVHVVGPTAQFPQVSTRSYTAPLATLESLQAAAEPTLVTRFVLVQPSFYGTDNSYLLETLDVLKANGRGVVVLDPAVVSSRQLKDLAARGVCGVRVNFYSKVSPLAQSALETVLQRFMELLPRDGWHIEVIATLPAIATVAPVIRRSPLPIVIDHYGLPEDALPQSDMGCTLLDLLRLPHVWMKVSAPYRVVHDPVATIPPSPWLKAFLGAAPDRCVWGSDWPHTPPRKEQQDAQMILPYRNIDYGRLFSDFLAALPEPSLAERILLSNPARLYGFGAAKDSRA